jgi:hypothetical protein
LAETGTFLSRDPVESEPPYQYVRGNPINLVDSSGRQGCPPGVDPERCQRAWQVYQQGSTASFPDYCRQRSSKEDYVRCVAAYYGIKPATEPPDTSDIKGSQKGCWYGSFPYTAPGYIEGRSGFLALGTSGREIVYDFATMERQIFTYQGGGFGAENDLIRAIGYTDYFAQAYGFRSNSNLKKDYEGLAMTLYFGISPSSELGMKYSTLLGVGIIQSIPMMGGKVGATGMYMGAGLTISSPYSDDLPDNVSGDTPGGPQMGASVVLYTAEGTSVNYAQPSVNIGQLVRDIYWDDELSPVFMDSFTFPGEIAALVEANRYARIHDAIYIQSQKGP